MGLDFTIFQKKLFFYDFFVKRILVINPSGIKDMETVVPPLKPAGPGGSFRTINTDFESM